MDCCVGHKAQGMDRIHWARDMTYRMQGVAKRKASVAAARPTSDFSTICDAPHATALLWPIRDRVAHGTGNRAKSLLEVCRLVSVEQVFVDFLHISQELVGRLVHHVMHM